MIFDTKLPIKLQFLQDSAKFFSFKRSGNPFKGRKNLAALLDFAAKNIGQRNAFLGRGDDLPNDGSHSTADDALGEGFPRGHPWFRAVGFRGHHLYGGGLPIFKRLKFLSLQTKGMLTAGQLETESLKVIENGRCKSSNVSRAPYQKHQKHEKHQKLNATSLLLNTTAKREQPRTQRSESYSSMKNNAFRNLSVWFMVWYGSIGNINHKLVNSRFQQLTYDNLFLLNKPSRSGFWTREACLKWFPWVRKTRGLGWSCWSSCSLTNRDGLPLPHHITFTNVSRTICAFTPFAQTRSLVCWFSHLLTPGALGLEAFRIEQRVPDFVVSMSSTRSTGHKLAPGSPSKWPFWKRVPCFEISVLLRDCIKELTFWGGTKQEVQGGTEEKAKISTYWILIVLDFNAFIQRIISDLSTFAKRHAFGDDLMLLLGENPNLQNWSISKDSRRNSSPISLEFYYIDPQDCKKGTYQPGTCLATMMCFL